MKGGRAQASKDVSVQFASIPPQRFLRSPARRQSWLQSSSPPLWRPIYPTAQHPNITIEAYFYLYYVNRAYIFFKYQAIARIQKYSTSSVADYIIPRVLLSLHKLNYENAMLLGRKRRRSSN